MKKLAAAMLTVTTAIAMIPTAAGASAASTHRTKKHPPSVSTVSQLKAVMSMSGGTLTAPYGMCGDGNQGDDLVQAAVTVHNMTKDETISAMRVAMTWSFEDPYQAVDSFTVEWDQVRHVKPGNSVPVSGYAYSVDCNNRAQVAVQAQAANHGALTFKYTPLEVVFTDGRRIGLPPK